MEEHRVDHRWGIPALDCSFIQIPSCFFRYYVKAGMTRPEFLFVLHLASYKFNSPGGQAHPSLETIAAEMNYDVRTVQSLRASLEIKGLLKVLQRSGETSIYNFQAMALRLLELESTSDTQVTPDTQGTRGGDPQITRGGDPRITPDPQITRGVIPRSPGGVIPRSPEEEEEKKKKQQQPEQESTAAAFSNAGAEEGKKQDAAAAAAAGSRLAAVATSKLREAGVDLRVISGLIDQFPAEKILEVVEDCKQRGNVRRPPAWIVAALGRSLLTPGKVPEGLVGGKLLQQRSICAFLKNPQLGACPSEELGAPAYPWCRACQRAEGT